MAMTEHPEGLDAADEIVRLEELPSVLLVMGVAGSGKTTVGELLARRLGWPFRDGDSFHPPANIEKMSGGLPLDDEDRWPWLRAIRAWIDDIRVSGRHGVVASSALKRAYRDVLVGNPGEGVRIVFLKGDKDVIARRLARRRDHFMPQTLLDSQFEALEEPSFDEQPIVVRIEPDPDEIVRSVLCCLADN